jgi:hypothetical protein
MAHDVSLAEKVGEYMRYPARSEQRRSFGSFLYLGTCTAQRFFNISGGTSPARHGNALNWQTLGLP